MHDIVFSDILLWNGLENVEVVKGEIRWHPFGTREQVSLEIETVEGRCGWEGAAEVYEPDASSRANVGDEEIFFADGDGGTELISGLGGPEVVLEVESCSGGVPTV